MAMDEAKRAFGLSFDEWLYKTEVANRNVAKPPIIEKPQESAVDDYSVLTTTSAPIVTAESFIDLLWEHAAAGRVHVHFTVPERREKVVDSWLDISRGSGKNGVANMGRQSDGRRLPGNDRNRLMVKERGKNERLLHGCGN